MPFDSDLLDAPKGLLQMLLRAAWWLGWSLGVELIGWSIGWVVLRVLTLGRYPVEPLDAQEQASEGWAACVELLGLLVLGAVIWCLVGAWPDTD